MKTAPVRHLCVKGLQKAQICLTMAEEKPRYLFKLDSWAYLCIDFQVFFLKNVVLQISNSAKKNFEKILKTVPVRHLFVNGLKKAQICLTIAKKLGYLSKFDSQAYLCINIQISFLENVVLQISNSAKKEFWKNIENCTRETTFYKGPSERSNLFCHGKKTTRVPLQIGLTSLFMHQFQNFFLEHVVLQISNSAKKEFGKNIKNCARETAFCDGPSESSNLFNHGK